MRVMTRCLAAVVPVSLAGLAVLAFASPSSAATVADGGDPIGQCDVFGSNDPSDECDDDVFDPGDPIGPGQPCGVADPTLLAIVPTGC